MNRPDISSAQQTLTIQQAIELAVQHQNSGDLQKARDIYKEILQTNPNHPEVLHLLGMISHQMGENISAVDLITKALDIKPDFPDALSNLGLSLHELGRLEEAICHYRGALSIKPDHAEAHNNLGVALQFQGQLDEAIKHYIKAIDINPEFANAYNNLGNGYRERKQWDKAAARYQKALSVNPNFGEAHSNLGIVLQKQGQLDEALVHHQRAVTINPDSVSSHNNLGNVLKEKGQLEKAAVSYQKGLYTNPNYAEVHYNLGDALEKLGRLEDSITSYNKALAIKPDYAEAHNQLGLTLHQLSRFEEAVSSFQKALLVKPDYDGAYNNLGNALCRLGRLEDAFSHYQKAININPDYVEAYYNLGNVMRQRGRLDDAIVHYQKAISINSNIPEVHNNLGNIRYELWKLDEAAASYRKALAIKPDYVEALINLGAVLHNLGQLDEAIANYQQALAIEPNYAEAHNNLGIAFQDLGKHKDAFKSHQRAVAFSPQNDQFWGGLAASLETLSFSSVDDGLLQVLWDVLDKPTVAPSGLTRPIISALRHHPDFSQLLELAGSEKTEIGIPYQDIADRLSRIPLLLLILQLSPIYDLEIERVLTNLRHAMLRETRAGKIGRKGLAFSSALAVHCFVNEYIFRETKEEAAFVERLNEQIAALMISGQNIPPELLVGIAAYRPLYQFPWANNLLECDLPEDLKTLIARQLKEPLEEISLRDQIPSLSIIRNAVSLVVRDQYEENPYPRWIKGGFQAKAKTIGGVLRAPPLRLDLGEYVSPEKPEILVAGCGTGQHAIVTVSRFSNAQVLAVDLSLSSLSYAMRKTKELGYSNIEYAQADIMELENLGRQFDLIECVGVLHHLENPLSGWRILVDLLRPGGLMRIGLYSELARQKISEVRHLMTKKGYTTSPDDIRRCRQEIIVAAKDTNPELMNLMGSNDFFCLSECRDLLFHVQEHHFTLPQIEAILQDLGMKFLGFELRDHVAVTHFKSLNPEKNALFSQPLWHEFELENPNTFLGMYQFWVQKI